MSNIEIGIDLGTTNSEIVIFNNGQYEVVKNTYGDEFTPSVFGVSKGKTEEVGKSHMKDILRMLQQMRS